MGFYNSPRIITDDLIFSIDAANIKSWSGPTPVPVGTDYGYFAGGVPGPAHMSTVQRIDFANDTTDATVRGPLSGGRYLLSAVGNNNFGYFGGSYDPPGPYSTIDRIDYSNDTVAATPKGPLSQTRSAFAGLGNSVF